MTIVNLQFQKEIKREVNTMCGSMILLNQTGDVKIVWTEEHELEMRSLIEKKLKEGYSFFIVKKKMLGLIRQKTKITSIDEVKRGSELLLRDEDAVRLFNDGKVVVEQNVHELVTERGTSSVDEILKNDTIAIRPIAAG